MSPAPRVRAKGDDHNGDRPDEPRDPGRRIAAGRHAREDEGGKDEQHERREGDGKGHVRARSSTGRRLKNRISGRRAALVADERLRGDVRSAGSTGHRPMITRSRAATPPRSLSFASFERPPCPRMPDTFVYCASPVTPIHFATRNSAPPIITNPA